MYSVGIADAGLKKLIYLLIGWQLSGFILFAIGSAEHAQQLIVYDQYGSPVEGALIGFVGKPFMVDVAG